MTGAEFTQGDLDLGNRAFATIIAQMLTWSCTKSPVAPTIALSVWFAGKCNHWEETMKKFVTMIVALGLATAFAAPTFAAEPPKTKADCEKAKMKWDDTAKKCTK